MLRRSRSADLCYSHSSIFELPRKVERSQTARVHLCWDSSKLRTSGRKEVMRTARDDELFTGYGGGFRGTEGARLFDERGKSWADV